MPARLASALKRAREQKRLSVNELALRSGVSRPMITEIEKGKNVSIDTLVKLAQALGLTAIPVAEHLELRIPGADLAHFMATAERLARDAEELRQAAAAIGKEQAAPAPGGGRRLFEQFLHDFNALSSDKRSEFMEAIGKTAYNQIRGVADSPVPHHKPVAQPERMKKRKS